MIYLELFWSFFRIGLFTFGGGYAALPLIQDIIVETNRWLSFTEFTDLITISEMTPGPIAINSSTFVGMHIAGLPGALVSTLGCILPSCLFIAVLTRIYFRYRNLAVVEGILSSLRPAIVSLIASAGLSIVVMSFWGDTSDGIHLSETNLIAVVLFSLSLFVLKKFKPNPIIVMAGSGLVGLASCLIIGG